MRLLFDQNLSPRLPKLLDDLFPDSVHVCELGLSDASDQAVWDYAGKHGYAIVSKDSDFQQRSLLFGRPFAPAKLDLFCLVLAGLQNLPSRYTITRTPPWPR